MAVLRKTFFIGNTSYLLPFRQSHCWVVDARDDNVCEAYNESVAKQIALMLNQRAQE